ncbi:MAG: benzoate-CoA ligase family protein [Candidatus Caldarchaeum sp.]
MSRAGFSEKLPEWFNICEYHLDRWTDSGLSGSNAVVDARNKKNYTYEELLCLTSKIANIIKEVSLELFDRVMLVMRDSVLSVAAFLASVRAGCVPFYVNPNLSTDWLAFYVRDSVCRLVLTDSFTHENMLQAARSGGKHVKKVLNVDSSEFAELIESSKDVFVPEKTHRDDPAYWVYTSGTTGRPKAAVHLHHDLVYSIRAYVNHVINVSYGDLFYSASKLYFSAGRVFGMHMPLMCGASTLIDAERSTPERVLTNLTEFNVTHLLCVPSIYLGLLNHMESIKLDRFRHPTLKWCVSGGEQLPASVFDRWKHVTGLEILNGIGSSEAEWIFISYRERECKPGAAGKIIPGWYAKLVDECGEVVKESSRVGTLYVKSDSVAAYYWRRFSETRTTFEGEWYNTRDMLYLDEEGFYHYVGRTDDLFKVHGMWVSPVEVEDAVLSTGLVSECAVAGVPSEDGLTQAVAFVTLKHSSDASSTEKLVERLRSALAGKLPGYKIPARFVVVDEIPKTPTGKVRRVDLRTFAPSNHLYSRPKKV